PSQSPDRPPFSVQRELMRGPSDPRKVQIMAANQTTLSDRHGFSDRHEFKLFLGNHSLSFNSIEDVIELLERVGVLRREGAAPEDVEQNAVSVNGELVEMWL